jgi:membrane protein
MGSTWKRVRPTVARLLTRATGLDVSRWRRVLSGTRERMKEDRLGLVAASIGFWATVSLFPSLVVLLTIYGLVSESGEVQRQVEGVLGSVSEEARSVVTRQLRSLVTSAGLGWGLVLGLVGVLWTVSSGMANAIKAVALAYGEEEQRPFLRLRALAIAFTIGALVVVGVATALVAILPVALNGGSEAWRAALAIGRWGGLVLLLSFAISALYRFAPQTRHGGWEWAIKGAIVVSLAWAGMSALFSVYARNFSDYAGTYGALAGLIILMFWFYLTGFLVVGGAAVAAEMWRVGEGEPDSSKKDVVPEVQRRLR